MASVVILLSSGPTAMKASIAGSRASLGDLVGGELGDRHLVGIDAGFSQDHPQQGGVGLGAADHADAMTGELADFLDLRPGCFLDLWPASPEGAHSTTTFLRRMATDSALPGRSRSPRATARSAFLAVSSAMLSVAPSVDDRCQPDREAVAGKGLRQRLDQFLVIAAGRADRDPQGDRAQHVIQRRCGRAEQEDAGGEHQQRIVSPLAASQRFA